MEKDDSFVWAQISRDNFVPEEPEGKWGWCPECGSWRKMETECERCRRREKRWEAMAGHEEEFLERWLAESRDRKQILLRAYEERRRKLLERGEWLAVEGMEQAEEEFAEEIRRKEDVQLQRRNGNLPVLSAGGKAEHYL